jgi:predicted acylesterase/phospholipase RssA
MIPPRRLVLSGGGIKVVALVGALKKLDDAGFLGAVKEVCGVSAGAFLALMLANGCPLDKIEGLILDLSFGVIRNMTAEAFLEFPERFGVDNGQNLAKFLESIVRVVLKQDPAITFQGLASLDIPGKKNLRLWATDLDTQQAREFSAALTPTVKIVDALCASMCLPMYFIPVKDPLNGHLLSDGAIPGSLPLHHLSDDECCESLSIGFCRENPPPPEGETPQDLMGFMNAILASMTRSKNDIVLDTWAHKIIRIPVDEFPSWNFEASRDDRLMLLSKGAIAAKEWLVNNKSGSRTIFRRHSG